VAYGTLLSGRRSRLHVGVARALADLDPDRADERAALIASHYEASGDELDAARWEDRAATWALRRDLGEAIRRWRAMLVHLASAPESPDALALGVKARLRLIQFGARLGMPGDEAERLADEGRALAERIHDVALLANLLRAQATARMARADLGGCLVAAREAVRFAAETGDTGLEASTEMSLAAYQTWTGPVPDAMRSNARVVALSQGDPGRGAENMGYSPLVRSYVSEAELLGLAGRLEEADVVCRQAESLARERGETEILAWALATRARLEDWKGEADDAETWAAQAVQVAEAQGNHFVRVIGLEASGAAMVAGGRPADGRRILAETLAEVRGGGVPRCEEAGLLSHLARAELALGDHEAALAAAEEAVDVARRGEVRIVECLALLTRAQAHLVSGGSGAVVQALADAQEGLALATELGAVTYGLFLEEELARLQGDQSALGDVLRRYRETGATGHALRLEAELRR
jgi:tetratricopeptide (TPR) repeat protein